MQAELSGLPAEQLRVLEDEVDADLPPLPPKLMNNAGVLHLRLGDTSAGAALFQEALRVLPLSWHCYFPHPLHGIQSHINE